MAPLAISVRDLGKRYRLGARYQKGRRSLREAISETLAKPVRRLGMVLSGHTTILSEESIWALRNVSFDVEAGEVVGVIGENGAGKTTLLKLLSRISDPTEGRAEIYGRVASLLEVGTGFHPDLTGRENVYLNGSILGMRREEIDLKFDEIVAFAGVERFIDTQVKHYSSGMYLRLAFAVAAHLEPEILLIDEVLAVGDAAFQRKCLGKMDDVARSGRTVLFVSHNMEMIQRLCPRTVWIEGGRVAEEGATDSVVARYLAKWAADTEAAYRRDEPSEDRAVLTAARVLDSDGQLSGHLRFGEPFSIEMDWHHRTRISGARYFLRVYDNRERLIFSSNTSTADLPIERQGRHRVVCDVPSNVLAPGEYSLVIGCVIPPKTSVHVVRRAFGFTITEASYRGDRVVFHDAAIVSPPTRWRVVSDSFVEDRGPLRPHTAGGKP